ncbi:hypothetical protein B0H19DRAFT_1074519 [Mycena capillaripes]|nr:hypothetical protein B0H19DRAFT_1074519 [Mycena capillaripes]
MLAEYNVNRKAAGRKRQHPSRMIDGGKMIIRIWSYRMHRYGSVPYTYGTEQRGRRGFPVRVPYVHIGGSQEGTEKEEWGVDEGEGQKQERPTIRWHQSHGMATQMISPEAPSGPGTSEKGDVTTLDSGNLEWTWLRLVHCALLYTQSPISKYGQLIGARYKREGEDGSVDMPSDLASLVLVAVIFMIRSRVQVLQEPPGVLALSDPSDYFVRIGLNDDVGPKGGESLDPRELSMKYWIFRTSRREHMGI